MQTLLTKNEQEQSAAKKLAFNWLANNPLRWRGKQVISKKNGNTYIVRDVMPRGSVELERKGVLYTSNVQSVRQDYEPACP
ncbi:MAG TPA: hypothetical protein VH280_15980 [Verrucomicrobiae bacterium]|jgi:hypothetical protein|nr:hypothetical protein [Verrucomicrobiae bacterium]